MKFDLNFQGLGFRVWDRGRFGLSFQQLLLWLLAHSRTLWDVRQPLQGEEDNAEILKGPFWHLGRQPPNLKPYG